MFDASSLEKRANPNSLRTLLMKETLNFRVSAEFKRRPIEEAEKERRSLTNYLETTLTRLCEEREMTAAKRRKAERS
jgi:predicted HicB family RNase H-like nuclease